MMMMMLSYRLAINHNIYSTVIEINSAYISRYLMMMMMSIILLKLFAALYSFDDIVLSFLPILSLLYCIGYFQ